MSGWRLFLISVFCVVLADCTAFHTPDYRGLPSKDSIVPGEEITVGPNQNVYGLAHKNGVSMREMIVLNDLKPPFVLHSGQTLVLPMKHAGDASGGLASGVASAGSEAPAPHAAPGRGMVESVPLDVPQSLPPNPSREELASQAARENPEAAAASASGALETRPLPLPPVKPKPLTTTVVDDFPLRPVPKPLPPSEAAPTGAPEAMKPPETKPVDVGPADVKRAEVRPPPPKTETVTPDFVWPVQGPIVSGFGAKGQGLNNDGINIAAPKGAAVVAASGGIVVYAGNEMKGFGNLVLVRHEGGWVTAYAHLDRVMVARDTVVASGDMIGTVGSTGGVAAPQLHFETRLNGKPVDPQGVIGKRG